MKNILIKTLNRLLKCHCRQKWSDCPFCFLSTKIQIKPFERKQNPKQDVTLVSDTGGYLPVHEDDDQHWQDDDSCSCPQTDLSSQWDSGQQRVAVVLNQSQVHLQVSHENLTEDMQTESEKGWVWEWVNHWPLHTNRAGKSLKSISALDMNPCKSQQLKNQRAPLPKITLRLGSSLLSSTLSGWTSGGSQYRWVLSKVFTSHSWSPSQAFTSSLDMALVRSWPWRTKRDRNGG